MDSEEAAEAAIAQLNGTDVKGRPMKVIYSLKKNKFETFQTIISFKILIPPVLKLAYVEYIKLKSRYYI